MTGFPPLLRRLLGGENLSAAEAASFVGEVMDANFTAAQSAAVLTALAYKGESVDEIVGAARAMRERSLHVEHGLPMVVDVVGTGGDHANTLNISTMAALVVAATGIPVAKHGNRAASSACGSADVLESAGFPIESRRRSLRGCCESRASRLCSHRATIPRCATPRPFAASSGCGRFSIFSAADQSGECDASGRRRCA